MNESEEIIALNVLHSVNIPKFINSDAPLF